MKIFIVKQLKLFITKLQFWKKSSTIKEESIPEEQLKTEISSETIEISTPEEQHKTEMPSEMIEISIPNKTKLPRLTRIQNMRNNINTQLLKLHTEQVKLKYKQIINHARLKNLLLLEKKYQQEEKNKLSKGQQKNPNKTERMKEHEKKQKDWVDFLIRQHANLAVSLDFNLNNPISYEESKIDMVKNKVNHWWKLYLQYHLGPKYQGKSDISYTCVIEHSKTNIHCHLAIKLNVAHITDEIVYDEEQLIRTLWKLVIPSGTIYVSPIWSNDWFKYMVKEFGFENKMFFSLK